MLSKKIFISTLILISCSFSYGQDLELISGGGTYTEGPNGSVAWSLGEVVIDTYIGTSNHVTQGFHQSDVYVVSVESNVEMDLSVYPNPTSEYINIVTDRPLKLIIFDMGGKQVRSIDLVNNNDQIDVSDLSRGTYSLMFESNGKVVKTIKILKQ